MFARFEKNYYQSNQSMESIFEFDVDFSHSLGQILHYKGYRISKNEFIKILNTNYFQDKVIPPEALILESYYVNENNNGLDNHIKNFMCDKKLTVCETCFPNEYGGFNYGVNYSFDNYKTFGFTAMKSKIEYEHKE
jgi:hypothetical protein